MQYNSAVLIIVCPARIKVSVWNIIRSNDATDVAFIIHALGLFKDNSYDRIIFTCFYDEASQRDLFLAFV